MQNRQIKRIKRADFELKQTEVKPASENVRMPANFWVLESQKAIKQRKAIETRAFFSN